MPRGLPTTKGRQRSPVFIASLEDVWVNLLINGASSADWTSFLPYTLLISSTRASYAPSPTVLKVKALALDSATLEKRRVEINIESKTRTTLNIRAVLMLTTCVSYPYPMNQAEGPNTESMAIPANSMKSG
nr:hypothetical protein [Sulfuracidifex tepidarius]